MRYMMAGVLAFVLVCLFLVEAGHGACGRERCRGPVKAALTAPVRAAGRAVGKVRVFRHARQAGHCARCRA